jgi:Arc/MetJ-type ribon-helix-helix transcriptional regulator
MIQEVTLTPEDEAYVSARIAAGESADAQEAIVEALNLLRRRHEAQKTVATLEAKGLDNLDASEAEAWQEAALELALYGLETSPHHERP